MLLKLFGYVALGELILLVASITTIVIMRLVYKSQKAKQQEEILELKKKIVKYFKFTQTLYINLKLLKYYEKVDIDTQIQIDKISDDINEFIPIYNKFVNWLKNREKESVTNDGNV